MNDENNTETEEQVQPEAQAPEAPVVPPADAPAEAGADAPAPEAPEAAPAAAEGEVRKEGDTCDIDGHPGTLKALQDGSLECVAVPQPGETCTTADGRTGTVDADGACLANQ